MLQLSFFFAIAALAGTIAFAGLLWRRGFFRVGVSTTVTTSMPIVIVAAEVSPTTKCGDSRFNGNAEVELIYLPFGLPRAEVRVALEIHRRNDVTVSLDSNDLGIFRNDATKSMSFSGELTKPCEGGDFTVMATVVSQGPGSTTAVEARRVDVDPLERIVEMPTRISTTNGIDFELEIKITCCEEGDRQRIIFTNVLGVNSLTANPRRFRCHSDGDVDTITVRGKKDDENRVGIFTVKSRSAFGQCVLGSVQVE